MAPSRCVCSRARRVKPKGILIFFHSGGNAARELFKAVIADKGWTSPSPALLELMRDIDDLAAIRNELVHGKWMDFRHGKANVSIAKPRSKSRMYVCDVSEADLEDFTREIDALTD